MRARAVFIALVAITAAGCGKSTSGHRVATVVATVPATASGYPALATQNTTRIASNDPVTVAATTALIVYPSVDRATRPAVVVLVDRHDWRAGIAASVLAAPPLRAPILLTDGRRIPPATRDALAKLQPTGAALAHGAQIIRIGSTPPDLPDFTSIAIVGAGTPLGLQGAIARFAATIHGGPLSEAMVVSADRPPYAMPAAALAAKSGVPVLTTPQDALAPEVRAALAVLNNPRIYALGPPAAISGDVITALRAVGTVVRIGGRNPAGNSVSLARYADPQFGWGDGRPGHGLVLMSATTDPQLAAATAVLAASGNYGPTVLLGDPLLLDRAVQGYLQAIQPDGHGDPAHGVYNHAWIVGDEAAVSVALQAQIDRLLEITPVP